MNSIFSGIMFIILTLLVSCASTPEEAAQEEASIPEAQEDAVIATAYTGSDIIGQGLLSDTIANDEVVLTIKNALPEEEYSYTFGDASGTIMSSADGIIEFTKEQLKDSNLTAQTSLGLGTDNKQDLVAQYKPNEIWTWHDLQAIELNLSAEYILMNNIIFPDKDNDGKGDYAFRPIKGNRPFYKSEDRFSGNINGNGYTIANLYIRKSDEDYVGLVGYLDAEGSIKDIHITNASITATGKSRYTGGIVGYSKGTIEGSYAGKINANIMVGGLVGVSENAAVTGFASADITAISIAGGLVGRAMAGTITGYSVGSVAGRKNAVSDRMGGLVGENMHGSIYGYSSANISGFNTLGGLVAECVAVRGGVPFQIVGFATGLISGTHPDKVSVKVGGIVSRSTSNIADSVHAYWDGKQTYVNTSIGGSMISSIDNIVYNKSTQTYSDTGHARQVFNTPEFVKYMELPGVSKVWPKLKNFPYVQPELP